MKSLKGYCRKALDMGLDGAKVIEPRSIITAEWVRMKCQFGCSGFGQGHCCPPYTPTPEVTRRVIDCYQKAILVHRRLQKGERSRSLTRRWYASSERFFSMDTIRFGAWDLDRAVCVKPVM